MLVLGIESSCDETAAAVVKDGRLALSNVIDTQVDIHRRYGGVVPEIASRRHVGQILPVVETALDEADVGLGDLDAICVTGGPGLIGSLLVGVSAAKGIASVTGLPLYAAHHIAGHIAANYIAHPDLEPPFICLVVSGGHSHIVHVRDWLRFDILARTRDDAAGEAFDKIARACGLGYPGGPAIEKVAQSGDPHKIVFPRTSFGDGNLDFSFSGVKTAALNYLNSVEMDAKRKSLERDDLLNVADFAASFQQAIISVLVEHTVQAAEQAKIGTIALAGGVAANRALREALSKQAVARDLRFCYPPPVLCTDNAAMIGALGHYMAVYGAAPAGPSLDARANWPLDSFDENRPLDGFGKE
ncbi:MAG: tRNA (adenosine(37)-N6)-threonylcarbamoyltransferase complex transferase subunit TsaD [Fastidiosipilaceae bacterium]